jgi:hypothetical protein
MSATARHHMRFLVEVASRQRSRRRQPKPATGATIGIITTVFTRRGMMIEAKSPPFVAPAIIDPAPSPTDSVGASNR